MSFPLSFSIPLNILGHGHYYPYLIDGNWSLRSDMRLRTLDQQVRDLVGTQTHPLAPEWWSSRHWNRAFPHQCPRRKYILLTGFQPVNKGEGGSPLLQRKYLSFLDHKKKLGCNIHPAPNLNLTTKSHQSQYTEKNCMSHKNPISFQFSLFHANSFWAPGLR